MSLIFQRGVLSRIRRREGRAALSGVKRDAFELWQARRPPFCTPRERLMSAAGQLSSGAMSVTGGVKNTTTSGMLTSGRGRDFGAEMVRFHSLRFSEELNPVTAVRFEIPELYRRPEAEVHGRMPGP